jgi:glycosyltransferase involved in cell wall biosynthesis
MLDCNVNLSLIVPVMNRKISNAALHSWLSQGMGGDYELVVVDYGSRNPVVNQIERRLIPNTRLHSVRVIRTEQPKTFSRGRALNLGVRNAVGDSVFFLDADIILPPKYLTEMERLVSPNHYVQCPGRELQGGQFRGGNYCWGMMGIPWERLMMLRGFDERMSGWGCEDEELHHRLGRAGLSKRVMTALWKHETHGDYLRAANQAHPKHETQRRNREIWEANRRNKTLVVNPGGWGEQPDLTIVDLC